MDNEAGVIPSDQTFKVAPVKKTCLDNLIIRDATADEKAMLSHAASELVANMVEEIHVDNRCSIIPMTPRGCDTDREGDGYMTGRSDRIQLTGIKPKALVFASPVKSPQDFNRAGSSTASTKDMTASASQQVFGLSTLLKKCENSNHSPEVSKFQEAQDNLQLK